MKFAVIASADVAILRVVGAEFRAIEHRVQVDLAHARAKVLQQTLDNGPGWLRPGRRDEVVGVEHAAVARRLPTGEAHRPLAGLAGHAERQAVLGGEVEVDGVEARVGLHRAHMAVEMGDVDAPGERLVDLRPALGPRLLDGGVGVDLARWWRA